MTRIIKYDEKAVRHLSRLQQHMVKDIADSINAMVEYEQMTPIEALEALECLANLLRKKGIG